MSKMKLSPREEEEAKKLIKYVNSDQFVKDEAKYNYNPMNDDIWNNGIWDGLSK